MCEQYLKSHAVSRSWRRLRLRASPALEKHVLSLHFSAANSGACITGPTRMACSCCINLGLDRKRDRRYSIRYSIFFVTRCSRISQASRWLFPPKRAERFRSSVRFHPLFPSEPHTTWLTLGGCHKLHHSGGPSFRLHGLSPPPSFPRPRYRRDSGPSLAPRPLRSANRGGGACPVYVCRGSGVHGLLGLRESAGGCLER